jgi:uncharacterized protein (TIGR00730 family)
VPAADDPLRALLDEAGATANRDVLRDILGTARALAGDDDVDRLDLKITASALKEMRLAFKLFAPFAGIPKVTIFGSARTAPDDPLYAQARDLAAALAARDWMIITGAGPGIMAAGAEGAGPDKALGVSIQLPFEEAPSELLRGGQVVAMKYFFTRKLMLIKESNAFVSLPGGFGTQDETFELLTLLQTGKAQPAPLVLLDVPGGTYWTRWVEFVADELVGGGLVSPQDHELYFVTDDVDEAVAEIERFWRNYHSIRWVGGELVVRLLHQPTDDEVAQLSEQFADLVIDGGIRASGPLPPERSDHDHEELPRLVMRYDPRRAGRLRALIDAVNGFASASAQGGRG